MVTPTPKHNSSLVEMVFAGTYAEASPFSHQSGSPVTAIRRESEGPLHVSFKAP